MPRYEYKVIPAPKKGVRGKGVKGTDGKFANALQALMNEHGAEGWEYQRTDTLPCEERSGLTGRTTVFQNMLVFRRELESGDVAVLTDAIVEKVEETVAVEKPAPTIEKVMDHAHGEAPSAGAADSSDPGKTANAPSVAAQ